MANFKKSRLSLQKLKDFGAKINIFQKRDTFFAKTQQKKIEVTEVLAPWEIVQKSQTQEEVLTHNAFCDEHVVEPHQLGVRWVVVLHISQTEDCSFLDLAQY